MIDCQLHSNTALSHRGTTSQWLRFVIQYLSHYRLSIRVETIHLRFFHRWRNPLLCSLLLLMLM